jgi:hypothetical protein
MKYVFLLLLAMLINMADAAMTLNPDVTQTTINKTICVVGYTGTVRPAVRYTNAVKIKLLKQANKPSSDAGLYELDHIVPLTLGGHRVV